MINKEYDEKIKSWIEENRDQMVEMWLDLIRIPSVRSDPAPGAPFGIPCAQALKKATEYGEQMGFSTRLEADRGYSLISCGRGEKTIGIFGHSDVVPAGDGWLYAEPLRPGRQWQREQHRAWWTPPMPVHPRATSAPAAGCKPHAPESESAWG